MDETSTCARCGRDLPKRRMKEIVYEEGKERVRRMVCPNCLDHIMNESGRVRGVVGTEKSAAAHIQQEDSGSGERVSMGMRDEPPAEQP